MGETSRDGEDGYIKLAHKPRRDARRVYPAVASPTDAAGTCESRRPVWHRGCVIPSSSLRARTSTGPCEMTEPSAVASGGFS